MISTYADGEKEEILDQLKQEKLNLEGKMTELKGEKRETEERGGKLKLAISNQESRRRMFDDNLRLREYKTKEAKFERVVRSQEKALDEMDWRKVEKKKNELHHKYNKLNAEKSEKGGEIAEVTRSVKGMERE